MYLPLQPVHIEPHDYLSYASDGSQPYDLFEIYAGANGTYTAAVLSHVVPPEYLPANLRGRKQRKYMSQVGMAAVAQTLANHVPEARFIALADGGMLEFALEVPAGQPVVPATLEQWLLAGTRAAQFYEQLYNSHSRLRTELDQRLTNAAHGTTLHKYFT